MAEPAASTAAGIAIAAGTITLSGTILGVHYDALLAGFFGGLVALTFMQQLTRWKIAGSVAASSLVAGCCAPIATAAALNYWPWLSAVGDVAMRMFCAVVIGISWQTVLPALLNRARSMLGTGGQQ